MDQIFNSPKHSILSNILQVNIMKLILDTK